MNDEIASGCGPHCGRWEDVKELERLRSLIAAWVDACEADRSIRIAHLFAVDPEMIGADPSDGDTYEAVIEAGKNLRKAVGR